MFPTVSDCVQHQMSNCLVISCREQVIHSMGWWWWCLFMVAIIWLKYCWKCR